MLALAKISPQLSVGSGPDLLAALLLRLRVLAVSPVASEALPRTWDLASGRSGRGGKALCFCSVAGAAGGAAELLAAGSLASTPSPKESFLVSGSQVLLELFQL